MKINNTTKQIIPLEEFKFREKCIYYWSGECWFKCQFCSKRCNKSLVVRNKEVFICDDCLKEVLDE